MLKKLKRSKMKLKVKLFADGAEKDGMVEMYNNPLISGSTPASAILPAKTET